MCKQNIILHILTKFDDEDVIHSNVMAILSTSTCGIFNIFYRNLYKKETAVILKRIYQLLHNLARVPNLVGSFDKSYKRFKFFYLFHCFLLFVCLLSAFCSNFDTPLEVQDVH